MKNIDPIVSSSPVKTASKKRKVREESQAEEEEVDEAPACKSHRAA
jgi:hypothetical protein